MSRAAAIGRLAQPRGKGNTDPTAIQRREYTISDRPATAKLIFWHHQIHRHPPTLQPRSARGRRFDLYHHAQLPFRTTPTRADPVLPTVPGPRDAAPEDAVLTPPGINIWYCRQRLHSGLSASPMPPLSTPECFQGKGAKRVWGHRELSSRKHIRAAMVGQSEHRRKNRSPPRRIRHASDCGPRHRLAPSHTLITGSKSGLAKPI